MSASKDQARSVAFNPQAPEDERRDALAQLHQSHMPASGDVLAPDVVAGIIEAAKWGGSMHASMPGVDGRGNLVKAIADHEVPRPGPFQGKPGMQSVRVDERNQQLQGEYWEKPAAMNFRALRAMVEQAPILNAVVLTRIRQIQRFCGIQEDVNGIGFTVRHIDKNHETSADERQSMAMLARFIQNCGWEFNPRERKKLRRDSFATFMGKLVRDSLTMDSCAIETEYKRDKRLGLDGLAAVDGETIRLTSIDGYRGDPDIFAVQVVDGTVRTAYTHDDLIYEPRNPRSDILLAGYGMAETELLVRTVTGFLNAMTYNIDGFSKNAIPKGVLHLSGDYSQDDLISFRRYWNSMVKGASSQWSVPVLVSRDQESRASFEKFGVDFDEMAFSKWITFLASLTCAIYGMSPSEINFDSFTGGTTSALSGSDTAEKLAESKDKGLRPLLSYFEGLISDYIISDFSDRYVFRWTGLDGDDAQERKERARLVLTLNEIRAQEGYDKIDGPLGDAPMNPSLIGPWMQLTQQQGQEGGDFDSEAQGGGDFGQGAHDEEPEPDFGQEPGEGEPSEGGDFGQGEGGERPGYDPQDDDDPSGLQGEPEQLHKANPYRDKRQRFSFALGEVPGLFSKPDIPVVQSRQAVLPDERLGDAAQRIKAQILQDFSATGGAIANRDTRHRIMVTSASVGHMLHLGDKHRPLPAHMEAASCAAQLMRVAVLAERHVDKKDGNGNLYIARYYAPFLHQGELYRAKLTVFENRQPGGVFKLYDHALTRVELEKQKSPAQKSGAVRKAGYKNGLEGSQPSTSDRAVVSISPASKISVRSLLEGVKRDSDGALFGQSLEKSLPQYRATGAASPATKLTRKPPASSRPGIALGDEVFCRCPKRGAVAGRVGAFGRDGFTLRCEGQDEPVRVPWGDYLGHKTRMAQDYTLLHDGEDGALVEDATGKRRYISRALEPGMDAGQDHADEGELDGDGEDELFPFDDTETPITKAIRMGQWGQ